MKVFLLQRNQDVVIAPELRDQMFTAMRSANLFSVTNARRESERRDADAEPSPYDGLTQDLELETLWTAMGAGDEFLFETAKRVMLSRLTDPEEIAYRQQVLADCLEHPDVVRSLYDLAIEALECERKAGGLWGGDRPDMILRRSVQILKLHVEVIKRLRELADEHAGNFRSEGFRRFFSALQEELDDEYLATLEHHLGELEFKHGLVETAELGEGNKGRRYVVREPPERHWTDYLPFHGQEGYSFTIPPRDESGFKALEDLRGRGLNRVANAVAQSADHVKSFFVALRLELAFYLGAVNLHERLHANDEPTCLPTPLPADRLALDAEGLYDPCLTLHVDERVVGNELHADGKSLVMITGANQGGKSTLLRSIGLAQLMLQSGMFVAAESLTASVRTGVFTHYKREEDATMESGKLDEELARMSAIADRIAPDALLLCNESFASTNEREGSEIARQVVRAMLDRGIRVLFVTHMYDLAHGLHEQRLEGALFLRAERGDSGQRTFKLREGEPLPTSYGADSYRRVFGVADEPPAATADAR